VEKNKALDNADNPKTLSNMLERRHQISPFLFLSLCSLLFFSSCTFPRIILLEDPLTSEEHLNLGVAYEKEGELDSAIREYKLATKKLPVAYVYLGNAYFQKNELDEAEQYYKTAIKQETHNSDAYNNLAWLYYVTGGNLNEAESLALKAMELNPSKNNTYRDTLEKIRELKRHVR